MKSVRYTKYVGDLAAEMDMEGLLQALSEYLLDSGFRDPYAQFQELDHNLEDLREALRRLLQSGKFFDQETQQKIDQMVAEGTLDEFIDKLIERMQQENYISYMRQQGETEPSQAGGQVGDVQGDVRFEVTDKSLDFLGFKALRDLLGSLGKSSFGRHDTRHWATGIEVSGASQRYQFGDTLNLDINATLSSAISREGIGLPLNLEYEDLHVHQCEYQSSCATVVMLDCSHSMILYGEDRFTPAKRVAMALSHLIRTQYPGDSLSLVLFHDSAEEMPVSQLARVKVGPVVHQYARRPARGATHSRPPAQGHEADRDDHRWQAIGAHASRRQDLQECLRPRSAGGQRNARRSFAVQAVERDDQYVHAGVGLWAGAVRTQGFGDVPRQGLFHDA